MTRWLTRLSHISFHVKCGQQLSSDLVHRFHFQPLAVRITDGAQQFAFKQGSAIFVVNGIPRIPAISPGQQVSLGDHWPILGGKSSALFNTLPKKQGTMSSPGRDFLYDVNLFPAVDTASNICFEVEDMQGLFSHLDGHRCRILVPPTRVEDDLGFVTYFVVKSLLGNLCHTLIDRSQYLGEFLPGFQMIERPGFPTESMVTHFDHVAFACPRRSTPGILEWYEKCFGFKRLPLSGDEESGEGLVISGAGVGLRLTGMHYWKCSKVDLALSSGTKETDCKFVMAESLPEQGRNQVDTFLEQHKGAGIQHVGLYTPNILTTVQVLKDSKVQFLTPPPDYYSDASKEGEILESGQDPQLLSQLGILLDWELNKTEASTQVLEAKRQYLMQIFTRPLFSEETFFLELIQRHGASGFGEGNIRALWRAVQAYMDRQEQPL